MATSGNAAEPKKLAVTSYQTALCFVPDAHLCQNIDCLRTFYDRAYGTWPAHINFIYPFVPIMSLPEALETVRAKLSGLATDSPFPNIHLRLDRSDYFSHRYSNTIYIAPGDDDGARRLRHIRSVILEDFQKDNQTYSPHLTIGQNPAQDTSLREHLLAKAGLLLPIEWTIEKLVVLVRERTDRQANGASQMKIWGTISLSGEILTQAEAVPDYHKKLQTEEAWSEEDKRRPTSGLPTNTNSLLQTLQQNTDSTSARKTLMRQPRPTYRFSANTAIWERIGHGPPVDSPPGEAQMVSSFSISSYNVLVDSVHPPVRDRYPLLLKTLLSEYALADVLLLQEVSDDFLSYILGQELIRSRYPFTTHGPPDQQGIGPLASLRNIVVLSRWNFTWQWAPFERRHKGAVIAVVESIGNFKDNHFLPLVVTGVHLTCGLTDGAIAAKKSQLQALVSHLSRDYAENPWVVAGDFNVTTSGFTVDAALKNKLISPQAATALSRLDAILSAVGLSDAWFAARAEIGETLALGHYQTECEDLYEGEQGATFDPRMNPLAAASCGGSPNSRPQRYDKVLVRGEDFLRVAGFDMFGFPQESDKTQSQDAEPRYGSDHWGIRATFTTDPKAGRPQSEDTNVHLVPLQLQKASGNLSDVHALKSCLAQLSMFPTNEEIKKRREAFALLKSILEQSPVPQHGETADHKQSIVSMVVVPVGSYGLGVWSTSSDIDCLCIGSLSAKTFFALAGQRLRKAADLGVRILRKVTATSGTMLELDVGDIKFDLQYCPAIRIAERWPEAIQLHPSDPLFDLPMLSLTKLKPFRDLDYLRRTIPDLASFRIAYRFISTWAKQRGIYSSKFGYLGGFHITLMLSRVCKLLFREAGAITAADIICTFFDHYAHFDWKTQIVFDPFFHKQQPRYHRLAREAIVILGPHTPNVNVAHTASLPSLRTLVEELKRADELLSQADMSWPKLVDDTGDEIAEPDRPTAAAHEFLRSYNTYIQINVQYWGLSLAKGSSLVGWLESRCVTLLVDVNRKLPGIHARIWPARFAVNLANGKDARDYQGCYLIGLVWAENGEAQIMNESASDVFQATLQTTLEQFADQIRSNDKYFDATSSWVDIAHVKRSELGELKLDHREWGNHVVQDDESETEDEAEGPALDLEDEYETAALSRAKPKKLPAGQGANKPLAPNKLRPALDILNRLRWDPNLDSSNYVIGYEDRFLGTREIVLDRWKNEKTDEEFIPQHRILYFRRSDGVRVWDRETRMDDVFGSGVGRSS